MDVRDVISRNVDEVRQTIADACHRAGRPADSVQLVAVTKYAQPDWVQALIDIGHTCLGESRPQQLAQRAVEYPDRVEWHLIGHLQRNKVDSVLPVAELIHSVDSQRLLNRISQSSVARDQPTNILLEVNVSGEESKDGFAADDLRRCWQDFCQAPGIRIQGLMTMAPRSDDPEQARSVFRGLRDLRNELAETSGGSPALKHLSMGMSNDFTVAIEEGATIVRIGNRLYRGLAAAAGGAS